MNESCVTATFYVTVTRDCNILFYVAVDATFSSKQKEMTALNPYLSWCLGPHCNFSSACTHALIN